MVIGPGWTEIANQLQAAPHSVRAMTIQSLAEKTGRNVIIYYSGFMQKPGTPASQLMLTDADMNGFMACMRGLDTTRGLDLVLHTPGGVMTATQAIVSYLRSKFGTDIRVIVPQLAMSAGTMLACAAKSIVLAKHSSLGPFDPQLGGRSTFAVISEFEMAKDEIAENPALLPAWAPILSQNKPGFLIECHNAIDLSQKLVSEWLRSGMFASRSKTAAKRAADRVVDALGDASRTKQHDLHVSADAAREAGLIIEALEDDQVLQDAVLGVHHCSLYALATTPLVKLIQSSSGQSYHSFAQPQAGAR